MSTLPASLQRFARDLLGELPEHPRSTCGDCPCVGRSLPAATRCCGTAAEVHNFYVGQVLDRPSVAARIAARHGVTPLGLLRSALHDLAPARLGSPVSLRCPHLGDGGACEIHEARPAACATWFCRPARGATGDALLSAVRDWAMALEGKLALHCALTLGLDEGPLRALLGGSARGTDGPDPLDDRRWAARWGRWAGREAEFYAACSDVVDTLHTEDLAAIGGVDVEVLLRTTRARLAAFGDTTLPARLAPGAHQVLGVGPDASWVAAWSTHDPTTLSALVASVLPYFDGRPLADALARMEEERGVRLDDTSIRELIDARLLVAV